MPNYPWMTPAWVVQAEAAEREAKPFLSQRRWTDKDVIVTKASPPSMFGLPSGWPIIPEGAAEYVGERALRVFLEITDGHEAHTAPPEAILVAKLSGADAVRAGLTKDDEFLVVPLKLFVWVAGALSVDKKVLLSLSQPIMERSLTHKDAEIWPELTWITPMKASDRKYYYAVLPLVGMGGVIDPQKGNPGIFRDLQADPYRHIVWDVVDEVIDGGTSAWGTAAASGDGAASLFGIKLRLVNFLRDLVDKFQEEEFERMVRRGEFDRQALARAIGDGLFAHLPDPQRIARENQWLKRADQVDLERTARAARAFRSYGPGGAATAITKGVGEGWDPDPQVEANRRVRIAGLCAAFDVVEQRGHREVLAEEDAEEVEKLAREEYLKGNISLELADIISDHRLTCPPQATADAIVGDWLRDFEPKLLYFLERYPA